MRFLGFLVAASIALALLQAAAKLAALLAIAAAIGTFYARPKESIGCAAILVLLSLASRFPILGLVLLGSLSIAGVLKRKNDSRPTEGSGPPLSHSN